MKIDDTLHGISTIIEANFTFEKFQGTGFFFQELGEKDPNKERKWVQIKEMWLITNRHVLLNENEDGSEELPEFINFNFRKILSNGSIDWEVVTLDKNELKLRLKLHPNKEVDVAAIRIQDLLTSLFEKGEGMIQHAAITLDNFPGNNIIKPSTADDVIVIGYPKQFYDKVNKFPIVKKGIIATRFGLPFEGEPCFLIDAKLFPGSSGSLVISKPIDLVVSGGQIFHNTDKQFAFLGIYSGDPFFEGNIIETEDLTIIKKDNFNLGIVWYPETVLEVISNKYEFEEYSLSNTNA